MNKGADRVASAELVEAGLNLMRLNEKPLVRVDSPGRSMIYALPNRERVRIRTCNDHVLIVVAAGPTPEASLNIEGTEWLLVIMPEIERQPGKVIAYLVPVAEAVAEVRRTHAKWLASEPRTSGKNTTWNLWFRPDGPAKASNYAELWKGFRLPGATSTQQLRMEAVSDQIGDVKSEVEIARQRIANAAGVLPGAVRITIDFGD